MKKTLTTCPYCGTGCGLYLTADDNNQLTAVEGAVNHPVSEGRLCIKGWNAFQFVNHPDRLTTPLIRRNDEFVPATWDEALNLVATKLQDIAQRYDNDALMFLSSARATNEENYLLMKLARAVFRTNNVDHCARLCHASTVTGLAAAFGSGAMTNSISCFDKTDCIFVIGSNTTEQHPLIGTRIIKAAQNGAKLIVADNRTIRLASLADLHIRHKNGSDVALLNGMLHVIIKEGLENKEFIATRTENYAQAKATVAAYTPEKVAAICGITPEEVVTAARLFATAKRAMLVYSMGITQHIHGVANVKACANLALVTGHIGREGCGVNPLRGQNNVQGACDMGALPNVYSGYQQITNREVRHKFAQAWHIDEENLSPRVGRTVTTSMDAALEGKIKAFYIMGENPVVSEADQHHVCKALAKAEFIVAQDIFFTPTCRYASVILPAVSFAEKEGTFTNTERRIQRVRQAIAPIGDARPDWQILGELAKRCGYDHMQYANPAEIMDEIAALTPSYGGIGFARLDALASTGNASLQWPCPDKNHPGTPILHRDKFARGPGCFSAGEYEDPAELPDAEYPFVLSTGRCYFQYHTGTMTRRTRLLEREESCPYIEINDTDARTHNIRDRDWIYVATRRGEVRVMARVTNGISSGVLFMPFHYEEAAANLLTINRRDPEAEIPEFKVCAAKIRVP